MRTIKFRGKMLDGGRWIYGSLLTWPDGETYILYDRDFATTGTMSKDPVRPETVGQYTGLKDKNGKEIYEGDIIQLRQPDGNCVLYEVSFCEKGYWAISFGINERVILGYINRDQIEVIGNIHDDPKFEEEPHTVPPPVRRRACPPVRIAGE